MRLLRFPKFSEHPEISKQIIDRGADYVLSLKGNQVSLHDDVDQLFDCPRKIDFKAIDHETLNRGHGHIKINHYWPIDKVEHLKNAERWKGFKRMGIIESERRINGQPRR